MDRRRFIGIGTLAVSAAIAPGQEAMAAVLERISSIGLSELQALFLNPPDAVKSSCYWWWFNGLVNKKSITRDLEEFRLKGMGAVLLVNSSGGLGGVDFPKGVLFLSSEWKELYRHALAEANRLKIDVGVNLSAGWCMGGPWITPENSGRWFLQSELTLTGPQVFNGVLPLPGNRSGYDHVFNPPGFKDYIDLPLEKLDYRDSAVIAFSVTDDQEACLSGDRLQWFPAKTNRKDASNFIRAKDVMEPVLVPWNASPADKPVAVTSIINLTDRVTSDGHLNWEVPAGRWKILRTGHRMTGSRLMIAPPEADGLSVDWLKSEPVDIQFNHLGRILLDEAAALKSNTLKYFCDDSFEDGFPNWTDSILEKFREYRGYDANPYLPVLAGYIMGNAVISDRFLHDYRKTVADCMADGHYKRFTELCHQNGLMSQNESAGPSRSGTMCMDGLKNLGRSDMPMGEFWLGLRHDEEGGLADDLPYGISRLENGQNKVTKMVASAAHIYGRKTASAEAFTTGRHWKDYPGSLKPAADRAFCEGINRLVIHTSTATRPEDGKPGYEYGAGTHFSPNVTWWNKSTPFLSYIARCQYLLQQGQFVADVLYYNGDWAPNIVEPKHTDPALGKGFDYDACNEEVLLNRLSVVNNRIVLPDGMSYSLLVLPDDRRMPVEVAKKIKELVHAGATVSGPKPQQDPGLKNYPDCDQDVQMIADKLWGNCDGLSVKEHHYGKGRICHGISLKQILLDTGIHPDFEYMEEGAFIDYIHRSISGTEVYFLANRNNRPEKLEGVFRVAGSQPEIWDPVSGTVIKAAAFKEAGGRTVIPLEFAPHQSWFIIFPRTNSSTGKIVKAVKQESNFPKLSVGQQLTGSWTVKFDPSWGGPASVQFERLEDWTQRPEDGIRYYSGTAVYSKNFDLESAKRSDQRFYLDLGVVKNIAKLQLNGKDLGIVWTDPWRVDVTQWLKQKDNVITIEIDNLWVNRLVGDASLPPEQRFTRTNIPVKKDEPLLPSGLLGPVTIQVAQ